MPLAKWLSSKATGLLGVGRSGGGTTSASKSWCPQQVINQKDKANEIHSNIRWIYGKKQPQRIRGGRRCECRSKGISGGAGVRGVLSRFGRPAFLPKSGRKLRDHGEGLGVRGGKRKGARLAPPLPIGITKNTVVS